MFLEINHQKEIEHNYWLLHNVTLVVIFRGDMGNKFYSSQLYDPVLNVF